MHKKKRLDSIAVILISLSLILLPFSVYAEEDSVYTKSIVNETSNLGRFGKITPILLGGDIISESSEKDDDNLSSNVDDGGVKKLEQKTSLKNPFIPFVYADPGTGCCANPDISDEKAPAYYCSDTYKPEQSVCCPSGGYTVGSPNKPSSQTECNASYFRPDCSELRNISFGPAAHCYIGCCYDVDLGECKADTEDSCNLTNQNNIWRAGFAGEGNPCYNTTSDTKAIENCSNITEQTSTCDDLNEGECISSGCTWCGTTLSCMGGCGGCPGRVFNNNSYCIKPVVNCSNVAHDTDAFSCIRDNLDCYWCPITASANFSTCFDIDNYTCGNYCGDHSDDSIPSDRICDTGVNCSELQIWEDCRDAGVCRWNTIDGGCADSCDQWQKQGRNLTEHGLQSVNCTYECSDLVNNNNIPETDLDDICCEDSEDNSENDCVPSCASNIVVNERPYYELNTSRVINQCWCPNSLTGVLVNDTLIETKRCCANGLSGSPCDTITIEGYIKDLDGTGVPATVIFKDELTGDTDSTTANLLGYYSKSTLSNGTYDVIIDITDYTIISVDTDPAGWPVACTTTGQTCTVNFTLNYTLGADPYGPLPCPDPTINANHIECELRINLSWSIEDCTGNDVMWYTIYRNGTEISGGADTSVTNLIDAEITWDTTYEYSINVTRQSFNQDATATPITTGDSVCYGNCNMFCLNDTGGTEGDLTMLTWCDNNNKIQGQRACITDIPPSTCVPSEDNADCVPIIDCPELGVKIDAYLGPNVLGMFYIENTTGNDQSCLTNGADLKHYCYYDYSDISYNGTTVDKCVDCEWSMFCYDYHSEDACGIDNCNVTKQYQKYNCTWYNNTGYSELGKGVCFAEYYDETGYCDECDPSKDLFMNTHCNPTVCDILGSCYTVDDENSSCGICILPKLSDTLMGQTPPPTTCESYKDERSCHQSSGVVIGNESNFSIPGTCGSNKSFTYSNDACGLGVCKWNGTNCYKDGDDDGIPDCGSNSYCMKDTEPPSTLITNYHEIDGYKTTYDGVVLNFSIYDYGSDYHDIAYDSWYCISKNDTCCPNTRINKLADSLTFNITLNQELLNNSFGFAPFDDNTTYLRIYSVDTFNNTEPIKSYQFDVDTERPVITVGNSTFNTTCTPAPYKDECQNLILNVSTSEQVMRCYGTLVDPDSVVVPIDPNPINNTIINPGDYETITYTKLEDGWYRYNITCKDDNGNENEVKLFFFKLDRIKEIVDAYPQTTIKGSINYYIEINTSDEFFCQYKERYPLAAGSFSNFSDIDHATHTYRENMYNNWSDGSYSYNITCYDTQGGSVKDSKIIYFTVDELSPNVTIEREIPDSVGSNYEDYDESIYYSTLTLRLHCQDLPETAIDHPVDNYGCDEILTCWSDRPAECEPSISHSGHTLTETKSTQGEYYFCYKADDAGGNTGSRVCKEVTIDATIPGITIAAPFNNRVDNESRTEVVGIISDNYGLRQLEIYWQTFENSSSIMPLYSGTSHNLGDDDIFIDLFPGMNTIFFKVYDNAVPSNTESITPPRTVYIDKEGPDFFDGLPNEPKIYDETGYYRIDNDSANPTNAEYLTNITFEITINDTEYTAVTDEQENNLSFKIYNSSGAVGGIRWMNNVSGTTGWSYTLTLDESMGRGNYTVEYTAYDKFNNNRTRNQTFYLNDTVYPDFTDFRIYNGKGQLVNQTTGFIGKKNNYTIKINASEDLETPTLYYYFTSPNDGNVYTVDIILSEDGDEKHWTGEFEVPFDDTPYLNINTTLTFNLTANDIHDNLNSTVYDYKLYTKGVKIDHSFPRMINVNRTNLTGMTDIPGVLVQLNIVNDDTGAGPVAFEGNSTEESNPIATYTLSDLEPLPVKEDTVIFVKYNRTSQVNDSHFIRFKQFEDNRLRYDIVNVTYEEGLDRTKIEFEPGLEANITNNEIEVYNIQKPAGLFNIEVNLSEGENKVYYKGKEHGEPSWGESNYSYVLVDTRNPVITNQYPTSTLPNNRVSVTARIVDSKPDITVSGVNESSILMNIFGPCDITDLTVGSGLTYISDIVKFDISSGDCNGNSVYLNDTYDVYLNASDNTGWSVNLSWNFTIDPNAPDGPDWTVTSYNEPATNDWYTKELRPNITAGFEDEVNITYFRLENAFMVEVGGVTQQATTDNKTFRFLLNEDLPEGNYTFNITAEKIANLESRSFSIDIFVDRTNASFSLLPDADSWPVGIDSSTFATHNSYLDLIIDYNDPIAGVKDEGSFVSIEGVSRTKMGETGTEYDGTFTYRLGLSDPSNSATVTVCDRSSNCDSKTITMIHDPVDLVITLLEPATNYTNDSLPTISINTNESANCTIDPYNSNEEEVMDSSGDNMSHNFTYYISGISTTGTSYTITCSDELGVQTKVYNGIVYLDTNPAIIEASVVPEYYYQSYAPVVTVSVTTKDIQSNLEPTICTYDFINEDYGGSATVTDIGFYPTKSSDYMLTNGNFSGNVNGNYTLNITCLDRASNGNSVIKEFRVFVDLPLTVLIYEPIDVTSEEPLNLLAHSNMEVTGCAYEITNTSSGQQVDSGSLTLSDTSSLAPYAQNWSKPVNTVDVTGNYTLEVVCEGSQGTETDSETFIFDNTPPVAPSITSPPSPKYANTGVFDITIEAEENSTNRIYADGDNIANISISGIYNPSLITTSTGTAQINLTSLGTGTYTVSIASYDYLENGPAYSVDDLTVVYDTIVPAFSSSFTVSPYYANNGTTVYINFTASESLNSTPVVTVNGNAATQISNDSDNYYYTYPIADNHGAATINITGYDLSGNPGNYSNSAALFVDNNAPSFTNEYPKNNSITNDNQTDVSITIDDADVGINTSSIEVSLSNGTEDVVTNNYITNCDALNKSCDITVDYTGFLEVDNYTVNINASDMLGNFNSFNWQFTINPEAPRITIIKPSDGATNSRNVTFSITSSIGEIDIASIAIALVGGGTSSIDFSTNCTTSTKSAYCSYNDAGIGESITRIIINVDDEFGNSGTNNQPFIFDETDPGLTVGYTPIISTNSTYLEVSASDFNAGLEILYLNVSNSSGLMYGDNINFTELFPGLVLTSFYELQAIEIVNLTEDDNYIVDIIVYDKAGNSNSTSITIVRDTDPPIITISTVNNPNLKPAGVVTNYYRTNENELLIQSIVSSDDLTTVINNTEVTIEVVDEGGITRHIDTYATDETGYFEFDFINKFRLGNNTVNLTATFTSGISSTETIIVKYDTEGPVIDLTNPVTGSTNSSTPLIEIRTDEWATDCEITYIPISGIATTDTMNTADNYNFSYQIGLNLEHENGNNQITITCLDEFSSQGTQSLQIYVDTVQPQITDVVLTSQTSDLVDSIPSQKWYVLYADSRTKIRTTTTEQVRCKYDSATEDYSSMSGQFEGFDSYSSSLETPQFTLADNTSYTYYIKCEDKAGWLTGTYTVNIEVNLNYPVPIGIISPVVEYVNQNVTELRVTTYAEEADCEINEWPLDKAMRRVIINGNYTYSIYTNETNVGILSDDTSYSFEVYCEPTKPGVQDNNIFISFTTDFVEPVINIQQPDYTLTNSSLITVSGTTEENSTVVVYVNGEQKATGYSADGTFNFEVDLDEGTNLINITVTDQGGNTYSEEVTVDYINVGPSISIILPSNTGPFRELGQVIARIVDKGGGINLTTSYITLENLSAPGTFVNMTKDTQGNDTLVYDITYPLSDGSYKITAVPVDNVNNIGDADSVTFEISNQVPVIDIIIPENMETVIVEDMSFNVTISSTLGDINSVTLVLNDNIHIPQFAPGLTVLISKIEKLREGVNPFYITVNTTLGYYAESPMMYVFLDTTPPAPKTAIIE